MVNSSLLDILGKFSKKEIKEFSEFVISPFFNKNKSVINLFNYLKKYYPLFPAKQMNKEYVYRKVFGDTYNDGRLRNLMFKLQETAEKYLMYKVQSGNEIANEIDVCRTLLEKGNYKLFEKKINSIETSLNCVTEKDAVYSQLRFEFEQIKLLYNANYLEDTVTKRDSIARKGRITPMGSKYLILNFLQKLLPEYSYFMNEQIRLNYDYKFELIDEILNYMKASKIYEEAPLLKINYLEILLLKEKDDRYFYELKETLVKEFDILKNPDKFSAVATLLNYCYTKQLQEDGRFLKERFMLDKFRLEQNLISIIDNKHINENTFLNIQKNAVQMKEYEWAEKFTNEYRGKLSEKVRDEIYNLSIARIYLAKGEYSRALESLSKIVKFSGYGTRLAVYTVTAKIYYEMEYDNQFYSLLDSFRHFIKKNEKVISGFLAESYLNFVKHAHTLFALKKKYDSGTAEKLLSEMNRKSAIASKEWFIEKIAELAESRKSKAPGQV